MLPNPTDNNTVLLSLIHGPTPWLARDHLILMHYGSSFVIRKSKDLSHFLLLQDII